MPSSYKWKPLPAGALGRSVNPETIRRNEQRASLTHLETAFERARANRGNRLKQSRAFAKSYSDYLELVADVKAEVDQAMIEEENEILEEECWAILVDWRQYYPNQFDEKGLPLANPPIPIEVPTPPAPRRSSPPVGLMRRGLSLRVKAAGRVTSATGSASSGAGDFLESVPALSRAATVASNSTAKEAFFKRTRLRIGLGRDSGAGMAQSTRESLSRPPRAEGSTSEYRLTQEDMEGDLDTTVSEEEVDTRGRPLIDWVKPVEWLLPNAGVYEEWEEDEEDEDVDFVDLYESADDAGSGEDSDDRVYGEDSEDEWDEEERGGEDEEDEEMEEEESQTLKSEDGDIDMMGIEESSGVGWGEGRVRPRRPNSNSSLHGLYGEEAENHFRASTQEIGEWLLGQAMTPKDFFTSPEEQQNNIQHIVSKRRRFLARNARLLVDLEAAAREDDLEQGINLEEMDDIDREMDRLALLNMASQQFPRRVKKEPQD
ncbi:hypothetical protein HOY82DRAFT_541140 [Tuber indicum]|nr:hypothetical protein HOY82DRAFT_541140 [Tuber indicum]